MAGGTGWPADGLPREILAERVVNTRARQAGAYGTIGFHASRPTSPPATWAAPPALPPTARSAPPPVRHCWYLNADLGRLPALLLKWRHTGDRHYDGLICTIALDDDGGYALVEMWVDAALLSPA